jgi:hypothetical protein
VLLTCNSRIKNIPGSEGEVSAKKKKKKRRGRFVEVVFERVVGLDLIFS